ncbi:hypothetical protein F4781DRAFT_432197 [Annulohypoxylon bovei var. microspora]|nr:hypothetical protein F4781DRAFT_432197 [Annulohypoxylon bovei var. microspora]
MENFDIKVISYDGEDIQPEIRADNEGWSTAVDDLEIRKFEGRRTHVPQPLSIHDAIVVEELSFLHRITMNLLHPGFDCGLGCFGNLSKIVETNKEEYDDLYWFDFFEITTAKELFDGDQVWTSDDDWIRFVRSVQKSEEQKTEEELIKFHAVQPESSENIEFVHVRPGTLDADKFLAELDDMELALLGEARTISTSIEYPRWVLRSFRDWIEEADFIEANVSTPSGTRYYTT